MQPKLRDKRLYWRGEFIWCRVLGHRGRIERKSTKCRTEESAVAVANELERRAADPTYAAASSTTLGGVIRALYADLARRGRSAATRKIAEQKCGHFVRVWGEDMPIVRASAALVLQYIDRRTGEGASALTIRHELGHLRQMLTLARFVGTFHEEVSRVIPPYFSGKHKPRSRWPSPNEINALVPHLEARRMAHLLFILATGARLSESYRARRADADWERSVVHIHGRKTAASDDDVPITRVSAPVLRWALEHAPGKDVLFHPWGKLHRDLEAACVRAGVAKLTPNDLRRGFAHWHRLAGIDVNTVSKMLRHTTDKLAQTTYAKVTGEAIVSLADAQIREIPSVPILYAATAETATDREQRAHDSQGNAAPPAVIETATNGLGKRSQNARSVGNKAAWSRRRAASVPKTYEVVDGHGDFQACTPRVDFAAKMPMDPGHGGTTGEGRWDANGKTSEGDLAPGACAHAAAGGAARALQPGGGSEEPGAILAMSSETVGAAGESGVRQDRSLAGRALGGARHSFPRPSALIARAFREASRRWLLARRAA